GRKRLELLHELVPSAQVIGALINPTSPAITQAVSRDLQSAARTLGLELHLVEASTEADFDAAFAKLASLRAGGLMVVTDGFFTTHAAGLAGLGLKHAIPVIYQYRDF